MSLVLLLIFGVLYTMIFFMGVLLRFQILDTMIVGGMYWTFAIIINRIVENKKWRVNVIIRERRGNTVERVFDKYKRVKKEGREWGELKRKRLRIRPIEYKFIEKDERNRYWAEVFSPAPNEFHPLKMDTKTMTMVAKIDPFFINWTINQAREAQSKWKKDSFLDSVVKYLPLIIIFSVAIIGLVIYTDQLLRISEPIIAAAGRIADSNDNLANAIKGFNETLNLVNSGKLGG